MAEITNTTDRLVVGFDFGTTFSGVAAAYSANPEAPDEINVIKTWPGGNNSTSDKVPSELTYMGANSVRSYSSASIRSSGSTNGNANRTMRWGFQVRHDEQRLRCLKLLLDPAQPLPAYVSLADIYDQLSAAGKDVDAAVAEYMTAVFDHTKEVLVRRYGQGFVSTTKLQVVLTVPAVWSDAAQNATLRAAQAAGMGDDIATISEPEAAAVYALQAIQPNHLKVGQNFVVIDAGGGTVDLITYSIQQLTPLRLEEVVRGSGGCCGAAFLNIRFENFVREKLGDETFERLRLEKPRSWPMALKYFEDYVKRNFDPDADEVFNIPFPGVADNAAAGIDCGFLCMDTADINTVFMPVIKDVVKLVEDQRRNVRALGLSVNAMILVGGFGQSECLLNRLRAKYSNTQPRIEVMQPVNAWTAVVRGAVLRGLEGSELILNRKARRHYGVHVHNYFQPNKHAAHLRYWDDNTGKWMARDQMQWYIKKGETVSSTGPVLFPFTFTVTSYEEMNQVRRLEMVACDSDLQPSTFSKDPGGETKVICTMLVNLAQVPRHLWHQKRNSAGMIYYELSMELGMQIESGGLRFDFRVDGVVYSKVMATFN
ncbi:actin-like ATPase domain-containing protein [Hortaea werneckii]|uniref:Actin-like ATPase domain-containing protein n=1 Tax=Hortaea werneckii EXF-2000 TaxID=1157616 RepID=A0A1Z5SUH2_HORWE|nr:actin-like ATPase domain-containing protein [Hortaea werneckii]OTA24464.1 hypothetical protein BTJ68_11965 [Hortaea werneckii EXF-2000]KAI6849342.1 actin-like ATPase domain-containing protein [Hortaea werneckii]KAI6933266.1 actin-like ATPase domain-containing protein [Hortaea werneckii]KAI6946016.1 actin-like ATPase domain-containing protein [Hortaea werneckii]